MNDSREAGKFAGELINYFFFPFCETTCSLKANGQIFRKYFSKLNQNIFSVICYFSKLPTNPYYKTNYFPRGYNALDFLNFCGKVASEALLDYKDGIEDAKNHAVHSIASCLEEFMNSGEFQRTGGWDELKEVCSKLSTFHVFCSVVCISNIS